MIKKKIELKEIVDFLGENLINIIGETDGLYVDNVADIEHVNENTLDWVNPAKINKQIIAESSKAKVLLVDRTITPIHGKTLLVVGKPRLELARIISKFFLSPKTSYIHPSAVIDNGAEIDPTAYIGAGCVIGKATIGARTILNPNVVVYDDVKIGNDCVIQAGAVIGTDGLGCMRDAEGKMAKFPHVGGVVIGNNVEIGANCQIAKGALSDTIISDGCKINGLCFIAHNSLLEENVWITGDTMLCGSTHVGKNTTIYSNVIIREQSHIGERVTIGMGSVVTKTIPDGETWVGNPAHKLEKK